MTGNLDTTRPLLLVRCPTCHGASVFSPANAHRPFCSERCLRIDFGAWATERYRVATTEPTVDEGPASTDSVK
jgi:endogenous inhibitor of DNA gyrase (YacG/DUF329 family)